MKLKSFRKVGHVLLSLLTVLGFLLGFLGFFSGLWYCDAYGDVGFDSVLFTLTNGVKGAGRELTRWYIFAAAIPAVVATLLTSLFLLCYRNKERVLNFRKRIIHLRPIRRTIAALTALIACICMLCCAAGFTGLATHVSAKMVNGSLYEKYYVAPQNTTIRFPEKKRNLVYIFLESMENTYMSEEAGGALQYDLIAELAQLAKENVSFSNTDKLGGFQTTVGTTWTTGGLIGASSGIHLQMPLQLDIQEYLQYYQNFLPGAYGITDLLHDNGYYQMFMCGSDASFGGRREFFTQHGVDEIYDLHSARNDNLIDDNYFEWWGFEDKKLFEYAKTQITNLSKGDQPFAFYMLTCDTHFVDGYICDDCPRDEAGELLYKEKYNNAIACSSKKVFEFVRWLQSQPFMENTTIVISGDHRTMDNNYMEEYVEDDYVRTQYNCFINSAVTPSNTQNRLCAPFDMYPSTVAAMGCEIDGDRLALGTNLFSQTPTVMEMLGSLKALNQELSYYSAYFAQNIAMTGKKEN